MERGLATRKSEVEDFLEVDGWEVALRLEFVIYKMKKIISASKTLERSREE